MHKQKHELEMSIQSSKIYLSIYITNTHTQKIYLQI